MFKRIKNLWNQSKTSEPVYVDITKLNDREFEDLKRALKSPGVVVPLNQEPIGDGRAEFFGEGTEAEFKEQEEEDKGFKGIFGK